MGLRVLGSRLQSFGFRAEVSGSGLRVGEDYGFGFRGLRIIGFWNRLRLSLGFRVWGLGGSLPP